MDKITSSGMVGLERYGRQYIISAINGYFRDTMITTDPGRFGDLRFIAQCLDYNEAKLSRGGTLKTNNVSLMRTPTDKYKIGIGLDTITISETDMADLMKCLKTSEGWDDDELALGYGLKKADGPEVRTIRDGKSFIGYVPPIGGDHFAIAVEKECQVRIYHLTNSDDWVDMFKLCLDEVDHVNQALLMIQDCIAWGQSISIASPCGSFDYDPEVASAVEISIGGSPQKVKEDEILEIIRVIDLMN